eukprot:TRINITY_DN14376_c0_g1_i2.p1 TRINITY_DN14376_c0_g1~~TRINITY_DN14376_c0_g1_i2.p1  ORF type:complete len:248 (-),score=16.74 TRINITY_DN14376_c0_g1_i2:227-970(-)
MCFPCAMFCLFAVSACSRLVAHLCDRVQTWRRVRDEMLRLATRSSFQQCQELGDFIHRQSSLCLFQYRAVQQLRALPHDPTWRNHFVSKDPRLQGCLARLVIDKTWPSTEAHSFHVEPLSSRKAQMHVKGYVVYKALIDDIDYKRQFSIAYFIHKRQTQVIPMINGCFVPIQWWDVDQPGIVHLENTLKQLDFPLDNPTLSLFALFYITMFVLAARWCTRPVSMLLIISVRSLLHTSSTNDRHKSSL